jgi:hypothetical protein
VLFQHGIWLMASTEMVFWIKNLTVQPSLWN